MSGPIGFALVLGSPVPMSYEGTSRWRRSPASSRGGSQPIPWAIAAMLPFVGSTWLGVVLAGCIRDWMAAGAPGLALRSDWPCVVGIPLTAFVPGFALAVMLRRGAPLAPRATTALGGLAMASLASAAMCLAQPHERDVIVLVWHGATITAMSVLAAITGRSILNWHLPPVDGLPRR